MQSVPGCGYRQFYHLAPAQPGHEPALWLAWPGAHGCSSSCDTVTYAYVAVAHRLLEAAPGSSRLCADEASGGGLRPSCWCCRRGLWLTAAPASGANVVANRMQVADPLGRPPQAIVAVAQRPAVTLRGTPHE